MRRRWHESSTDECCKLSALAGVDVGYALEGTRWLKLPKKAREALKPLLNGEERKEDPFEGVTWVAPLHFDGTAYRVYSIPGDKSHDLERTIDGLDRESLSFASWGPPCGTSHSSFH